MHVMCCNAPRPPQLLDPASYESPPPHHSRACAPPGPSCRQTLCYAHRGETPSDFQGTFVCDEAVLGVTPIDRNSPFLWVTVVLRPDDTLVGFDARKLPKDSRPFEEGGFANLACGGECVRRARCTRVVRALCAPPSPTHFHQSPRPRPSCATRASSPGARCLIATPAPLTMHSKSRTLSLLSHSLPHPVFYTPSVSLALHTHTHTHLIFPARVCPRFSCPPLCTIDTGGCPHGCVGSPAECACGCDVDNPTVITAADSGRFLVIGEIEAYGNPHPPSPPPPSPPPLPPPPCVNFSPFFDQVFPADEPASLPASRSRALMAKAVAQPGKKVNAQQEAGGASKCRLNENGDLQCDGPVDADGELPPLRSLTSSVWSLGIQSCDLSMLSPDATVTDAPGKCSETSSIDGKVGSTIGTDNDPFVRAPNGEYFGAFNTISYHNPGGSKKIYSVWVQGRSIASYNAEVYSQVRTDERWMHTHTAPCVCVHARTHPALTQSAPQVPDVTQPSTTLCVVHGPRGELWLPGPRRFRHLRWRRGLDLRVCRQRRFPLQTEAVHDQPPEHRRARIWAELCLR